MTNRLKILLTILILVLCYTGIKIHTNCLIHRLELEIAEKKINIYNSIGTNAEFIRRLNNKIK